MLVKVLEFRVETRVVTLPAASQNIPRDSLVRETLGLSVHFGESRVAIVLLSMRVEDAAQVMLVQSAPPVGVSAHSPVGIVADNLSSQVQAARSGSFLSTFLHDK